MTFALVLAKLP